MTTKDLPSRLKKLLRAELRNYWANSPIRKDTILYESFSGNGLLCHPEALFRYIISEPRYKDYKHTIVLNDFTKNKSIIAEFANNPNVKFVKYLTLEYYKSISTSKYLFNNVSFPAQFVKREGQIYVNTWHGIPLKKMGYDVSQRAIEAKNIVRNFLSADFLLSSSEKMTEEMYEGAFKLTNVFEGSIIHEGSPRLDRQQIGASNAAEFKRHLTGQGIAHDDRKIILYAPTWKGESYFNPHNDGASLLALVKYIETKIDVNKYRIMLKAHQIVADGIQATSGLRDYLIPNSMPTNVALGMADLLITDYSSIFFDFLNLNRPVIFYTPDYEDYRRYRNVYMSPDELPGPVVRTAEDLGQAIASIRSIDDIDDKSRTNYQYLKTKYLPYEDGGASRRIADAVLNGDTASLNATKIKNDGKLKLLIYAGGMIPNGITTSALNLLDNINYDKYDVTVLCPFSDDPEIKHNFKQINPKSRVMFRYGSFNGSYVGNLLRLVALRHGSNHWAAKTRIHEKLWKNEWRRCFGATTFDHMIDFSGYTSFWGTLFLHGPSDRRSIWLHNDLAADALRSIEGNQPLKEGLYSTFSIYKKFDNLVSVSEGLSDINRTSLLDWSVAANFCHASNTINAEKIFALANRESKSELDLFGQDFDNKSELRSMIMSHRVSELIDPRFDNIPKHGNDPITLEHTESFFTFISAGRLSPEKNHLRLIRAFSKVHSANPATRLVIAGEGPLRSILETEIRNLGLIESVKLVGHTKNPFRLMKFADAFVLSSDYEGQPMVLLEALVLDLPVITTSFGSVRGALPADVGKIVEPNVESLADAMLQESLEPTQEIKFNVIEYNERAIKEFESIIDG